MTAGRVHALQNIARHESREFRLVRGGWVEKGCLLPPSYPHQPWIELAHSLSKAAWLRAGFGVARTDVNPITDLLN